MKTLIKKTKNQEGSPVSGRALLHPKQHLRHGWNPDLPDHRDHIYQDSHHFHRESVASLPTSCDLRKAPATPPIEDQGQLGSCTAFGTLAAARFVRKMQGHSGAPLSHLFQYWCARHLEGSTASDSGATIRDAFKALHQFGAIPEKELPYDIAKFAEPPTAKQYKDALKDQALEYLRVENDKGKDGLRKLCTCLAAGYPVVFGASLYESFENPGPDANGLIPLPKKGEQQLGGHCMALWGYNAQERQAFLVRNSWGKDFGVSGYIWIPFAYLTNPDLADDFWTLRKMEA